ncbi:MAG TPA: iron-containing alcohol dehydrogenase [Clostridiales bacterium]|nr:iron-containing alcohol dehydrogenase [Clostridiales bacterium]HQK74070.1 iron-containing alcohol dehydrogenase [Clostridiales bacterium]
MDLKQLTESLRGCPCGRAHTTDVRAVVTGSGLARSAGEVLAANTFPKDILLVADRNTLAAAQGVDESVERAGFHIKKRLIYPDLRKADTADVEKVERESAGLGGILSVGTGSLNDICRLAAYRRALAFAIFATAPSMDGFASDTSPITANNFKLTLQARQPSVIMADTKVLAAAPAHLKSAGFGDMIGKFTALADWRAAALAAGEYYCPNVARITEQALEKICALAASVTLADERAAGEMFEALVLTGLAMGFARSVRPASGAEHVVSHFWECKKLQEGLLSDFHGKKVGVATVAVNSIYHNMLNHETVEPLPDEPDWPRIRAVYGPGLEEDMMKQNTPAATAGITGDRLKEKWPEIRAAALAVLPGQEQLTALMRAAGAATAAREIGVSDTLYEQGLVYSPYMRRRVTLLRLRPMLGL